MDVRETFMSTDWEAKLPGGKKEKKKKGKEKKERKC